MEKHLANMSTPVQQGKVQNWCLKTQVSAAKEANAQLGNQVGNKTLGHKTIGQTAITSKVSTSRRPKHN